MQQAQEKFNALYKKIVYNHGHWLYNFTINNNGVGTAQAVCFRCCFLFLRSLQIQYISVRESVNKIVLNRVTHHHRKNREGGSWKRPIEGTFGNAKSTKH